VKFGYDFTQQRPVGGLDGARNLVDEFVTDLAFFIPHLEVIEHGALGGIGNVDILSHAALAGLTE
jgi:hypothetical protein